MKTTMWLVLLVAFFGSCKEKKADLHIILYKSDVADSSNIALNKLHLSSKDVVFLSIKKPNQYKFKDTIKMKEIPNGIYTLAYRDILGNEIIKKINLSADFKEVRIQTDSINALPFRNQTPFVNLKDNCAYSVEMTGGCVASLHGNYTINRLDQIYYISSEYFQKRVLDAIDIAAIIKFESELLAIEEKSLCESTGNKTYQVNSESAKTITDKTCNWNGWSNLFAVIHRNKIK